jgi:hypothetical protein
MYVHVYVREHVCIRVCTSTYMYTCLCVNMCMHAYVCMYMHIYVLYVSEYTHFVQDAAMKAVCCVYHSLRECTRSYVCVLTASSAASRAFRHILCPPYLALCTHQVGTVGAVYTVYAHDKHTVRALKAGSCCVQVDYCGHDVHRPAWRGGSDRSPGQRP